MKKILVAVIATLGIVLGLGCVSYATELRYPDLKIIVYDNLNKPKEIIHDYAKEITKATDIKVLHGYDDGLFRPDEPIIRAEFIKSLICLATNRSFDFDSVDSAYNAWYGPYVTLAETQEIIEKNQYTTEQLEEPITRIEMVSMLSKTQIRMKGIPQTQIGTLRYTDIERLTKEEKELLLHAVNYDLLDGMKNGTDTYFQPNKYLTRGEAAAALMRIY